MVVFVLVYLRFFCVLYFKHLGFVGRFVAVVNWTSLTLDTDIKHEELTKDAARWKYKRNKWNACMYIDLYKLETLM